MDQGRTWAPSTVDHGPTYIPGKTVKFTLETSYVSDAVPSYDPRWSALKSTQPGSAQACTVHLTDAAASFQMSLTAIRAISTRSVINESATRTNA